MEIRNGRPMSDDKQHRPAGRSNCLIFALGRFFSRGGYLLARRSRWGWWPHFLWAESLNPLRLEHFTPLEGGRPRLLPPLLFKGHILDKDQ